MAALKFSTEYSDKFLNASNTGHYSRAKRASIAAVKNGVYASVNSNNGQPIKNFCVYGNIYAIKWILKESKFFVEQLGATNEKITCFSGKDSLFPYCIIGGLKCAKFIYQHCKDNNIKLDLHTDNFQAFIYRYKLHDKEMIDWLFSISSIADCVRMKTIMGMC